MDDTNTNQTTITAPLANPAQDISKSKKWGTFIKGAVTCAVITGGIKYAARTSVGLAGFAGPVGIALAMATSAIALTGIDVYKDYREAKQTMKTKEALKSLIAKDKLKKYGLKFAFNLASSAVGAAAFLGAEALIEHTAAGAWVKDTIVGLMPGMSGAVNTLSPDDTTATVEDTQEESLFLAEPANVEINPPEVETVKVETVKAPLIEESGHFLERLNADLDAPKEPDVIQGGQSMVIQPVAEGAVAVIEEQDVPVVTEPTVTTPEIDDTPAFIRMIGDWIDGDNAPDVDLGDVDNTADTTADINDTVEVIVEPENDIVEVAPTLSTLDRIADVLNSTEGIGKDALDTLNLAQNGDPRAVKDLAVYFFNGTDSLPQDMRGGFEGIEKNTDLAIELYKQAAEAGYKPAQADLNYIEKVLGFSLETAEVTPVVEQPVIIEKPTPVDDISIAGGEAEITTPEDIVPEDMAIEATDGMAATLLQGFNNFIDSFMESSDDVTPANDTGIADITAPEPELEKEDPPDAGVAIPLLTLGTVSELFSSTDNMGQKALDTLTLAENGNPVAIKDLAVYFFNGTDSLPQDMRDGFEGIEKNRDIAIELYKQAAEAGYVPAQADLDYIESRGWLPESTANTNSVSNIIEEAQQNISDIGDINALSATDQLIQEMAKQDLSPQAQGILDGMIAGKSWAIESAGIGILNGQFGLPTMPEDFAIELIQQAADNGNENARLNMAYFQYHGLHGVELDRDNAIEIIKDVGRPWVGGDEVFYHNTSGIMGVKEGGAEVALCQVFENSNNVDCDIHAEQMHANDYMTVNLPNGDTLPIYLADGARTHNTVEFAEKRMVEVLNTQPPIKPASTLKL